VREPEPEIIRRARDGDLAAFESLVRAYQADAWRFAYHLTGNRATAEDATQEAFLRAFRAIRTYHGESKFTNWLLRIVRNAAIDAFRKTRREISVAETREPALGAEGFAGTGLREVHGSAEDRYRIAQAIRALPIDLREPFVVIEVLGFDYQEASAILSVKLGTLKSRMHRARAALIRSLSDEGAADEV
jgi:RNA polymerase sigma-70 factor (ECF subfamily)